MGSLHPLDTCVDTPVTHMTDVTVVAGVCLVMCQVSITVVGVEPRPPHVMTDVTVVAGVCLVMCQVSTTVAGGEPRPPHVSTCSQSKSASRFVRTRNE